MHTYRIFTCIHIAVSMLQHRQHLLLFLLLRLQLLLPQQPHAVPGRWPAFPEHRDRDRDRDSSRSSPFSLSHFNVSGGSYTGRNDRDGVESWADPSVLELSM